MAEWQVGEVITKKPFTTMDGLYVEKVTITFSYKVEESTEGATRIYWKYETGGRTQNVSPTRFYTSGNFYVTANGQEQLVSSGHIPDGDNGLTYYEGVPDQSRRIIAQGDFILDGSPESNNLKWRTTSLYVYETLTGSNSSSSITSNKGNFDGTAKIGTSSTCTPPVLQIAHFWRFRLKLNWSGAKPSLGHPITGYEVWVDGTIHSYGADVSSAELTYGSNNQGSMFIIKIRAISDNEKYNSPWSEEKRTYFFPDLPYPDYKDYKEYIPIAIGATGGHIRVKAKQFADQEFFGKNFVQIQDPNNGRWFTVNDGDWLSYSEEEQRHIRFVNENGFEGDYTSFRPLVKEDLPTSFEIYSGQHMRNFTIVTKSLWYSELKVHIFLETSSDGKTFTDPYEIDSYIVPPKFNTMGHLCGLKKVVTVSKFRFSVKFENKFGETSELIKGTRIFSLLPPPQANTLYGLDKKGKLRGYVSFERTRDNDYTYLLAQNQIGVGFDKNDGNWYCKCDFKDSQGNIISGSEKKVEYDGRDSAWPYSWVIFDLPSAINIGERYQPLFSLRYEGEEEYYPSITGPEIIRFIDLPSYSIQAIEYTNKEELPFLKGMSTCLLENCKIHVTNPFNTVTDIPFLKYGFREEETSRVFIFQIKELNFDGKGYGVIDYANSTNEELVFDVDFLWMSSFFYGYDSEKNSRLPKECTIFGNFTNALEDTYISTNEVTAILDPTDFVSGIVTFQKNGIDLTPEDIVQEGDDLVANISLSHYSKGSFTCTIGEQQQKRTSDMNGSTLQPKIEPNFFSMNLKVGQCDSTLYSVLPKMSNDSYPSYDESKATSINAIEHHPLHNEDIEYTLIQRGQNFIYKYNIKNFGIFPIEKMDECLVSVQYCTDKDPTIKIDPTEIKITPSNSSGEIALFQAMTEDLNTIIFSLIITTKVGTITKTTQLPANQVFNTKIPTYGIRKNQFGINHKGIERNTQASLFVGYNDNHKAVVLEGPSNSTYEINTETGTFNNFTIDGGTIEDQT